MKRNLLLAVYTISVFASGAHASEVFWREMRRPPQRGYCQQSQVALSPNGKRAALWAAVASYPGQVNSDLVIYDVDCLVSRASADQCALRAFQTNASPSAVLWSSDSQSIFSVAPQITITRFSSPDYLPDVAAMRHIKSDIPVGDIEIDGPFRETIEELSRDITVGLNSLDPHKQKFELKRLRIYPGGFAVAYGARRDDLRAALIENSRVLLQGFSSAWIGPATPFAGQDRPFLFANGKIVGLPRKALGDRLSSGASALGDDLNVKTPSSDAPSERSAIEKNVADDYAGILSNTEEATAAILSSSRTPRGDVVATLVRDINIGQSFRIRSGPLSVDLSCGEASTRPAVRREVVNLGRPDWPLPATLYKAEGAKKLVLFFPGGPGATNQNDSQLAAVEPFLAAGYSALVILGSGAYVDGLSTSSRIAREGGRALDTDAALIAGAIDAGALGQFDEVSVYAESFGALGALALMENASFNARSRQYILGGPWLVPRDPLSWTGARFLGPSSASYQALWERKMLGLNWQQKSDPFRRWVSKRRVGGLKARDVHIIYSESDPTFRVEDFGDGNSSQLHSIEGLDHSGLFVSSKYRSVLGQLISPYRGGVN